VEFVRAVAIIRLVARTPTAVSKVNFSFILIMLFIVGPALAPSETRHALLRF